MYNNLIMIWRKADIIKRIFIILVLLFILHLSVIIVTMTVVAWRVLRKTDGTIMRINH